MGEIRQYESSDLSPELQARLRNPIPEEPQKDITESYMLENETTNSTIYNIVTSDTPVFRNWETRLREKRFLTRANLREGNVTDEPDQALFLMIDKENFPSDWGLETCQTFLDKWCRLNELAIREYEQVCPRITGKVMIESDYDNGFNPTKIFNESEDKVLFDFAKTNVPRVVLHCGSIANQQKYSMVSEFEEPEYLVLYCQIDKDVSDSEVIELTNKISNGYVCIKKSDTNQQSLNFILKLATILICSNVKSSQENNLITKFCFETYKLTILDKHSKNTSLGVDLSLLNSDRSINFDAAMKHLSGNWKENTPSYRYLEDFDSTIDQLDYDSKAKIRDFFEYQYNKFKDFTKSLAKLTGDKPPGPLGKYLYQPNKKPKLNPNRTENVAEYYNSIKHSLDRMQFVTSESMNSGSSDLFDLKREVINNFREIILLSDSEYDVNEEFKIVRKVWLSMAKLQHYSDESYEMACMFNHIDPESMREDELSGISDRLEITKKDIYLFQHLGVSFNLISHFYSYNTFQTYFEQLETEIRSTSGEVRERLQQIFGLEPIEKGVSEND